MRGAGLSARAALPRPRGLGYRAAMSAPTPSVSPASPSRAGDSRVALITGASSGIGEALAIELSRRGWRVGLMARRASELEALAQKIGPSAAWRTADVLDEHSVNAAVAALEAELGPCELMIANAGIGEPCAAKNWDNAVITRVMRVNYEGVVFAFGAVIQGMLARGKGQLAAVSSVAGYRGLPTFGPYAASKSAVTTLCESLRIELSRKGVAVTTIHPGYIATPMTAKNKFPMPFLMPAEAAARVMADGLEARRREINTPWQMGLLMGLCRLLPNWIWDRAVGIAAPKPIL